MNNFKTLRQFLHRYPELSSQEYQTVEKIEAVIIAFDPTEIIPLASTGRAFVFDSGVDGKTTMIRSELDALPIQEENKSLEHKSNTPHVAHLCGHDGHMAIVSALAEQLHINPPKRGKVVLLFQPAEETGQGAFEVLQDPKFKDIKPDYIYALHNIPGEALHQILLKQDTFASASKGATIKLYGKTSHAAEPENGISPTLAMAHIIQAFEAIKSNSDTFDSKILLTVVHINLGEIAFGTSPGYAELRVTLRAFNNSDLDLLTQKIEHSVAEIAQLEKLKHEIKYSEIFPATVSHPECFEHLRNAALHNNLEVKLLKSPYKWSEDFGYYTQEYKGGFFGLGSGKTQPALHNPNYDFPDEIIETGVGMFMSVIQQINF